VKHLNHQLRHIDGSRSVAQDARVSEHGLGNHGTDDPLVEPLTYERRVKKENSRTPRLSCPLPPGLWALLLDDLGRITGNGPAEKQPLQNVIVRN